MKTEKIIGLGFVLVLILVLVYDIIAEGSKKGFIRCPKLRNEKSKFISLSECEKCNMSDSCKSYGDYWYATKDTWIEESRYKIMPHQKFQH